MAKVRSKKEEGRRQETEVRSRMSEVSARQKKDRLRLDPYGSLRA